MFRRYISLFILIEIVRCDSRFESFSTTSNQVLETVTFLQFLPRAESHQKNRGVDYVGESKSTNEGEQRTEYFVKARGADQDAECRDVMRKNDSDKCNFVKATDDCNIDEGFINYVQALYCGFSPRLLPLGMCLLVLWWLFLFMTLAITADEFFCPSLVVMAKVLRMSDNIAGVTLLAFGNGAPDVFSAIAAVGSMKNGDAGLAVGALVGAGVFVTTIVAGSVAIARPFEAMQRPFLRDIVFYLVATFMTFLVLYDKVITLVEAIAFLGVYVLYVVVVTAGRYIYQRQKERRRLEREASESANEASQTIRSYGTVQGAENQEGDAEDETGDQYNAASNIGPVTEMSPLLGSQSEDESESEPEREFTAVENLFSRELWSQKKWWSKFFALIKMPAQLILVLTVPVVIENADKKGWNRYLNSLHCLTAPVTAMLCANHQAALHKLGGVFPVWALLLLVGFVLLLVVFFTSSNEEPPLYHPIFAFLGFIVSVFWIDLIANEIVNLLQTFGVVFNLSNAVLGLTLLAWGNSLGDLIADTTMARQGYPRTGISACFGGPLFNLLLGIGIPFTIKTISSGSVALEFTRIQIHLLASLTFSLLSSLILLPLLGFHIGRRYGAYLFFVYFVFLVLALLMETHVI